MRKPDDRTMFILKFIAVVVLLYLAIAWNWSNDHVIVPYTAFLARTVGHLLNLTGQALTVQGTVVASSRFGMDVRNGCNGVEAMALLIAAIVAFPASIRDRMQGLGVGMVFVQVVNIIRLCTLYFLGAYYRSVFDLFHTAVWQSVIILITVVFFLVWSGRVQRQAVEDQ